MMKMENQEKYNNQIKNEYQSLIDKYSGRNEEEKQKDEGTKIHERYRRNQQRRAYTVDLKVEKSQSHKNKPGTYFYGTLKKLAEDFDNLKDITRHMTLGQNAKYQERDGQLWNLNTGLLAYDSSTHKVFE